MLLHGLASKTNHKLVRIYFALIWCWDKPWATLDSLDSPRPGLGGNHHLPPYSILCVTLQEPHPNGTFSRDSQRGIRKLSRVGLSGLWELISPGSNLQLEWGQNQSRSSPQELFNAPSHSLCRRREKDDSRLLVVRVKLAVLLPALLLPITWAADVQMAHARPFQTSTLRDLSIDIKNTPMRGVLTLEIKL